MTNLIFLSLVLILGNVMVFGGAFCIRSFFRTQNFFMLVLGASQWSIVATYMVLQDDVLKLFTRL